MGNIMDGDYGIRDGLRAVHIWIKYINTQVHICILNEHIDNTQRPVPSPSKLPQMSSW